jgi:uridine nucleosidase
MAIISAFNWDEIEVIGITTLFGNVPVDMATDNALLLRERIAEHNPDAINVPVCRGSSTNFRGDDKHRIADFVHGQDGFGNRGPGTPPKV